MKKIFCALALFAICLAPSVETRAAVVPAQRRAAPTLEQRVADLEAYVNNGARIADNTNNVSSNLGSYDEKSNAFSPNPGPGHNAWQMVSAGAGAVHDAARPGAVLRRPGPAEERSLRPGAMPRHRGPGDDPLVAVRLQPGVSIGGPRGFLGQPRLRRS